MAHPRQLALTFPENWPSALRGLSVPARSIPVEGDDLIALGGCSRLFRDAFEGFERRPFSPAFLDALAQGIGAFPEGAMPRIGYGSWKSSTVHHRPLTTLDDVMATITRDDDRIARGLLPHAQTGEPAALHLRQWRDIPAWSEFRLFVRGARAVGASQYHAAAHMPAGDGALGAVRDRLLALAEPVIDAFALPDFALDAFVDLSAPADRAVLIEINPLDRRTELCLFGSLSDLDGSLRFRDGSGRAMTLPDALRRRA